MQGLIYCFKPPSIFEKLSPYARILLCYFCIFDKCFFQDAKLFDALGTMRAYETERVKISLKFLRMFFFFFLKFTDSRLSCSLVEETSEKLGPRPRKFL